MIAIGYDRLMVSNHRKNDWLMDVFMVNYTESQPTTGYIRGLMVMIICFCWLIFVQYWMVVHYHLVGTNKIFIVNHLAD